MPQIIANPTLQALWVALAISLALTGSAWLLSTVLDASEAVDRPARTSAPRDVIPS